METNQFIVGKWYRFRDGQYARFTKTSSNNNGPHLYFHWSERLDSNLNHEYYDGSWMISDVDEEANMSIIACQLPYTIEEPNYQIY